jgi:hypothetical protein
LARRAGWTVETIKEHFDAILEQKDTRDQQRYDASQKALEAALLAADRAVQAALQAAKEAVQKAEMAADKRFELLNELRIGVATTEQLEALEKVVNSQREAMAVNTGQNAGSIAQATAASAKATSSRAVLMVAIAAVGLLLTSMSVGVAVYAITHP